MLGITKEIGDISYIAPLQDTIFRTWYQYYCKMSDLPFSCEKLIKIFRQALLEVITGGSRRLAPSANTRSSPEFCAAVDIVPRVLYVYPTCIFRDPR